MKRILLVCCMVTSYAPAMNIAMPVIQEVAPGRMNIDVARLRALDYEEDRQPRRGDAFYSMLNEVDTNMPLHYVALTGRLGLLRQLLDAGTNVDVRDYQGYTALHYALRACQTDSVTALLAAGANVEARTKFGETPLQLAAERGDVNSVIALLNGGANRYSHRTGSESPIVLAIKGNHVQTLRILLWLPLIRPAIPNVPPANQLRYFDFINAVGRAPYVMTCYLFSGFSRKYTPTHLAAELGHSGCLEALIEAGTDVNAKDINGNTPLHLAAARAQVACMQILLANRADLDAANCKGETPLHRAAQEKNVLSEHARYVLCIQELVRGGANRYIRNNSWRRPRDCALMQNYHDRAALLA